ncbi:MAG TPA: SRPBCC domain-containing protein [Burkholderiaceae bacterium]|nr:SRPBCC domain-containing protein [Burkholderiaceae bacterium]
MNHYQHSLRIEATPAAVYAALTTPAGLRGWWTQDCDVAGEVGGTHRFRFECAHKDMRVEHLDPGREVQWLCTAAHIGAGGISRPDEWVGTRLAFRLAADGATHTRLDFEHVGLVPTLECYELCRGGWQHYLRSLQQWSETGHGTPHRLTAAAAH